MNVLGLIATVDLFSRSSVARWRSVQKIFVAEVWSESFSRSCTASGRPMVFRAYVPENELWFVDKNGDVLQKTEIGELE